VNDTARGVLARQRCSAISRLAVRFAQTQPGWRSNVRSRECSKRAVDRCPRSPEQSSRRRSLRVVEVEIEDGRIGTTPRVNSAPDPDSDPLPAPPSRLACGPGEGHEGRVGS
jgi:hypothetical protein